MKARITVTLKKAVLDPQGKAIEAALSTMNIANIDSVRQGKIFDMEVTAGSADEAKKLLNEAARKLLANEVIEEYHIEMAE